MRNKNKVKKKKEALSTVLSLQRRAVTTQQHCRHPCPPGPAGGSAPTEGAGRWLRAERDRWGPGFRCLCWSSAPALVFPVK